MLEPGGHKEMSLSWLTNSAHVFEPKCGGEGESANEYSWGRIQRKTWYMEPYAGADYNLTLCPHQGRLQHIYLGSPMPE
jgi:hypothetical protein